MTVSRKFCRSEYDNLAIWLTRHCGEIVLSRIPSWDEVKAWAGCIVGTMDYDAVDIVPSEPILAQECGIWSEGYKYWWILSNIRKLPMPIHCRGNVGMWHLPREV